MRLQLCFPFKSVLMISAGLTLSGLSAAGCKKLKDQFQQPKLPPPQTGISEQVAPSLAINLDAGLTPEERNLFRQDISFIESLTFKSEAQGYFQNAFSGGGKIELLRFLDDRIGYIIGKNSSVDSRFSYTSATNNNSKAVTIATNIGTAVWLETIAQRKSIEFFVNNSSVPVTDPRIGIVRLADGYSNYGGTGKPMNTVARTTVLIHEARHSDCTGGLNERDVLNLSVGQLPENRSCGHLHTICESGDYEGLPACDGREWGSYAIGWLYANQLSTDCANCTESMRQVAKVVAIDALLRVSPQRAKDMVAGTLPPPDLSSTPTRP